MNVYACLSLLHERRDRIGLGPCCMVILIISIIIIVRFFLLLFLSVSLSSVYIVTYPEIYHYDSSVSVGK